MGKGAYISVKGGYSSYLQMGIALLNIQISVKKKKHTYIDAVEK